MAWQMLQESSPSVFARDLAVMIWGEKDLANRSLEKVYNQITSRSPVKIVEPELLRLYNISMYFFQPFWIFFWRVWKANTSLFLSITGVFNDYLENKRSLNTSEKTKLLLKATSFLSAKIRDLRSEAIKVARRIL